MPLRLNTLLLEAEVAPSDVRLLRHQDRRSAKGRTPYELWRDERASFDRYQSAQSFSNRPKLGAGYWASFVVSPAGETLLAGVYSVRYHGVNNEELIWPNQAGRKDLVGTCDLYELTLIDVLNDFVGRLVIEWGEGERAWIQRADNQDKLIMEIKRAFSEPEFPGFAQFLAPLSKIEGLPVAWLGALSSSRGIYLLTCQRTREQYVGSATGSDGFFGRWLAYARDGHGGNVGLKSRDPSDYQVSILEVAGSSASVEQILEMERLWKLKLQSRGMGLNKN